MSIFGGVFDNIYHGHDFHDDNGITYGHSEPNAMGGYNYFDTNNHMVAHTESYVHGTTIYSDAGIEGTWQDLYPDQVFHEFDGGTYHYGQSYSCGNLGDMMGYEDPLAHISDYIMPDLLF